MEYQEKLLLKEASIHEGLSMYLSKDTIIHPIIESPIVRNYRNKSVFGLRNGKHTIINKISSKISLIIINTLLEWITPSRMWNNVTIRNHDKDVLVHFDLVISDREFTYELIDLLTELVDLLVETIEKKGYNIISVTYQATDTDRNPNKDDPIYYLFGPGYLKKELVFDDAVYRFKVSPKSFYQVNDSTLPIIYKVYKEWCQQSNVDNLIGLGDDAGHICIVLDEMFKKTSCYLHCSVTAKLFPDAVLDHLPIIIEESTLIVNPGRGGLKGSEIGVINDSYGIKTIIYAACSMKSVDRDISMLKDDYEIKEVILIDQFPHTPNYCEIMIYLCRKD